MKSFFLIIFIFISKIINLISSKSINFLSKFEEKKTSVTPISFLEEPEEKRNEQDNDINLERFLKKYYMLFPKNSKRKEDYLVKDPKDKKRIKFNFLKNTKHSPDATVVKIDGNQTIRLSGKKDYKNSYIKTIDNYSGVAITFNQEGDICNESGKKHQTTFLVKCDYSNKNLWGDTKFTSSDDNCNHQIEMSFSLGCSFTSGVKLYKFIKDYKETASGVFIVIGLIICFLGAIFFNFTVYVISGTAFSFIFITLILMFKPEYLSSEKRILICLAVVFVIGCILGRWLKNKAKLPIGLLGGLLGYSANSFIYDLIGKIITIENGYAFYGCMTISIILGILVGFLLVKYVAIIGTAAFGGYIAGNQGISILFPEYGEYSVILWVLLSIMGFYFQWKHRDKIGPLFDKKK